MVMVMVMVMGIIPDACLVQSRLYSAYCCSRSTYSQGFPVMMMIMIMFIMMMFTMMMMMMMDLIDPKHSL